MQLSHATAKWNSQQFWISNWFCHVQNVIVWWYWFQNQYCTLKWKWGGGDGFWFSLLLLVLLLPPLVFSFSKGTAFLLSSDFFSTFNLFYTGRLKAKNDLQNPYRNFYNSISSTSYFHWLKVLQKRPVKEIAPVGPVSQLVVLVDLDQCRGLWDRLKAGERHFGMREGWVESIPGSGQVESRRWYLVLNQSPVSWAAQSSSRLQTGLPVLVQVTIGLLLQGSMHVNWEATEFNGIYSNNT